MNNRMVIDTSVMFKWFVAYGENGLEQAWDLLTQHRDADVTLIAPASALVELANTLRHVGIGADDASALLADFERTHVVMFEDTAARARRALGCAFEHRITVYDALFLTLAQEFDCPLVTADRRAFGRVPPDTADVRLIL